MIPNSNPPAGQPDSFPQLAAVSVLAALLAEHPTLPPASWSIQTDTDELRGNLGFNAFDELTAYAEALGGAIRPDHDFESGRALLRPHRLHTVWRGVRIEITVYRPAPAVKAVAA